MKKNGVRGIIPRLRRSRAYPLRLRPTPSVSRAALADAPSLAAMPFLIPALASEALDGSGQLVQRSHALAHVALEAVLVGGHEGLRQPEVPNIMWSMDSRAGAIFEAEEPTGNLDAARKLATHSSLKTTLRHLRNDVLESNRKTATARQT